MSIRNHVTFRHPAPFIPVSEEDGIASIDGVGWFVDLLRKIPRLEIRSELCQEDWGVVIFGTRDRFEFWFGLSFWEEHEWLAHVHHSGLFKRFRAAGKAAYSALISDLHEALRADESVTDPTWYLEAEMNRGRVGEGRPDPG